MSYGIGPQVGVVGQTTVPNSAPYPGTTYSSMANIQNGVPEAGALLARALTMRGEGPPVGALNLGAQAPGMVPGNTLDYANGLERRRGYTPTVTITRDLYGQNITPGIFAFHFVPDSDFGAAEDIKVKERIFNATPGEGIGEQALKSHDSVRLKQEALPVFNLEELNVELFRRQFYREPDEEYKSIADFLRHNNVAVCGYVDTAATNAVVPIVQRTQREFYGPKRVDVKIQGDARGVQYSVFGNNGVAGKPCQFIVLAVPLTVDQQNDMLERVKQFVRKSAKLYPYQFNARVVNMDSLNVETIVRHASTGSKHFPALTSHISRDVSERLTTPYQRSMASYRPRNLAGQGNVTRKPKQTRYFYQVIGWPNTLNPMQDIEPDGLLTYRYYSPGAGENAGALDFAVLRVATPRNSYFTVGEDATLSVKDVMKAPVRFDLNNVMRMWKIATTFESAPKTGPANMSESQFAPRDSQFSAIDPCTTSMYIMPNGFHPAVYCGVDPHSAPAITVPPSEVSLAGVSARVAEVGRATGATGAPEAPYRATGRPERPVAGFEVSSSAGAFRKPGSWSGTS